MTESAAPVLLKYQAEEQGARAALAKDPDLLETRAELGKALLSQGRFRESLKEYKRVAAADPSHRGAHLAIAGLMTQVGLHEKAQDYMGDYFARTPLSAPQDDSVPPRPLVLKLRGFDRTRPMIGVRSDGSWVARLRGGHFTTSYLLLKPDFAMRTFTIAEGNMADPEVVPPHDLILNTIAEPDIEASSLATFRRYLEQVPEAEVINRPERVAATARDRNWQRLRDFSGATFPWTVRIKLSRAGPKQVIDAFARLGVDRPVILRETGTQTGRTAVLIDKAQALADYARGGLTGEFYVIDYRQILWRGEFFRKLRLFHIDGTFYPVVCHLDRVWNVHGSNRKEVMRTRSDLMAEEKSFLADWQAYVGSANVGHLEKLAEATGLEFFGIDFTLDEEGKIFIYELNAAMRHSFDHSLNFPYKLPYDHAVSEAFAAMVRRHLPAGESEGSLPA